MHYGRFCDITKGWRCLADYEPIMREGNHFHKPTCTYYFPWDQDDGSIAASDDESGDED
jgi:hypothetical protein